MRYNMDRFHGIFPAVMIISFVAFQSGSRITWKKVQSPDKWGWFTAAAGGAMLTAELLCAKGYITRK